MHTIGAKNTSFDITIHGRAASLHDLMPAFGDGDRLGIVVRDALGGVGASALMLALVLDFYASHDEEVRALPPGAILYPQHYVFHIGRARGDYSWLDVWPPDKEVVVDDSAEAIVRALVDHRITRLLVEDHDQRTSHALADHELEQQLVTCLAFSSTGRTAGADVRIVSNEAVERWVGWTIDPERAEAESGRPSARSSRRLRRASEVSDSERDDARQARTRLVEAGRPVETYRHLSSREAVGLLVANG
jgi:hypothetical protein